MKKIIGKVKKQRRCGSCWAFSAIAEVEQVYALFKNETVLLSEQELVDCAGDYDNEGCNGGWEDKALLYIKDHGINLAENYPYRAINQVCKSIADCGEHKIKDREFLPRGPKPYFERLRIQPTTASFHVKNDFFQYKSGIYNTDNCSIQANHAVNAIGFGLSETEGQSYFLVRNSWGGDWGDQGYFKIAMTENHGVCGFSTDNATTYAILE